MGKPSNVVAQSILLSDFLSMCRLCLSKSNVNVEIFNDNHTLSLPFRIMACASLEISPTDQLPKQICEDCRYQLEKSYVFRKRCKISDTKLHRYIRKLNANQITHQFENPNDEEEFADSQEFFNDRRQKKMQQLQKKIEDNERDFQRRLHDEGTIRMFDEVKQHVVHMDTSNVQLKNTPLTQREIKSEIEIMTPKFQIEDEPSIEDLLQQIDALCDEPQEKQEQRYLELNDDDVIVTDFNVKYEENDFEEDSECQPLTIKESDSNNDTAMYMEPQEKEEQKNEDEENSEYKPKSDKESDWSNDEESDSSNGTEPLVLNRSFKSLNSMGRAKHLKRRAGKSNDAKIFICKICSKNFSMNWILERHMTVHTGDRPFKCQYCNKSFSEKFVLHFHINRKHSDNSVAVLNECPFCPKTFAFPSGLSRHLRIHTGKLFPCKYCGKKFKNRNALRWHSRSVHPVITV